MFPEYEILRPGKPIWGQLAKGDQPFTVTFHDLYAVVSFDIGPSLSSVKCAALWVRIGLLEAPEQLQDIPVGTKVEVEKKGL
jgi:hypothetical protein